jgi:hypothetical protein
MFRNFEFDETQITDNRDIHTGENAFFSFYNLGAFAKLCKSTKNFVTSVCLTTRPHATTWLPLDGF